MAMLALRVVGDARRDATRQVLERLVGEWDERPAMEVEPLRHPEAVAPLDQRLRLRPLQGEVVFAIHALDVGDILEPRGRHVDDGGAVALQERVGGDGRADADRFEIASCGHRSGLMAFMMASTGRDGVDGVLATTSSPVASSIPIRSVKVPPVSIPSRTAI